MAKIIGNTTATPNPQPDWLQNDPTKADYIKNKPISAEIVETYILNIDYNALAFDTSEIVIGRATSPILGVGMLGYMVLG